jgi:seryl-tRNA synthetase
MSDDTFIRKILLQEGCGFKTTGDKTQVYRLDSENLCLAGTAEMSLAGIYSDNQSILMRVLKYTICLLTIYLLCAKKYWVKYYVTIKM